MGILTLSNDVGISSKETMSLKLFQKYWAASKDDLIYGRSHMPIYIYWNSRKSCYYGYYYATDAKSAGDKKHFSCGSSDKIKATENYRLKIASLRERNEQKLVVKHRLSELEKRYVANQTKNNIRPTQIASIQSSFRLLRKKIGYDCFVDEITTDVADSFIFDGWGEDGNYGKKIKASTSTMRKHKSNMGKAFRLAKRLKWIIENPFEGIEISPDKTKHKPDSLTMEEFLQMISGIDVSRRDGLRLVHMCKISFYTNLRISEVLFLEEGDIKTVEGKHCIHIQHKNNFVPKWGTERFVPLPNDILSLLDKIKHANEHSTNKLVAASSYFFPNSNGRPFSLSHIDGQFLQMRKILLPQRNRLTFHSLRHSWGRIQVEAGVSLEKLMIYMGHKDIRTTGIYARMRDSAAIKQYNFGTPKSKLNSEAVRKTELVIELMQQYSFEQIVELSARLGIESKEYNSQQTLDKNYYAQ